MEEPVKNPIKQFVAPLIINGSMSIYALCTFIAALKAGIAWRILLSATGLVLFLAVIVIITLRILKLRKEQRAEV